MKLNWGDTEKTDAFVLFGQVAKIRHDLLSSKQENKVTRLVFGAHNYPGKQYQSLGLFSSISVSNYEVSEEVLFSMFFMRQFI